MAIVLNNALNRLKDASARITGQRRHLVKVVISVDGHFDAEEIARKVKPKGVSRATVYRSLPILEQAGIIKKAYSRGDTQVYELSEGKTHHDHMLCLDCGKAIEFADERIECIQQQVCREAGFDADTHKLVISGLCRECRLKRHGSRDLYRP